MLRLPLCSKVIWLTLMCCRASWMNNVRLLLTTQPSKLSSRLGTFSEATGPFSRFNRVAEKFLIWMPKNWIWGPWVSRNAKRVDNEIHLNEDHRRWWKELQNIIKRVREVILSSSEVTSDIIISPRRLLASRFRDNLLRCDFKVTFSQLVDFHILQFDAKRFLVVRAEVFGPQANLANQLLMGKRAMKISLQANSR